MEGMNIVFDDKKFDEIVATGLIQGSEVTLTVKEKCTRDGLPGVVISFVVDLPDGSMHVAQATTTLRLVRVAYGAILAKYPDL